MTVDTPVIGEREAIRELKARARSGDPWSVLAPLARLLESAEVDYTRARALHGILKAAQARAQELRHEPPGSKLRLAVVAGATSSQFVWMLELFLAMSRIFPQVYEAPYGVARQEILDPDSGFHRFQAQVLVFAPGPRAVVAPSIGADPSAVDAAVEHELAGFREIWDRLGRGGVQVVQDNFVLPPLRPLGSLEASIPGSETAFLARLNRELLASAPAHVRIHDLDHIAGWYGKRAWFDDRFYFVSKQPCALEALPAYASSVASLVRAIGGRSRKCLVLDLDNTLWGGVVGDDGVEGLRLGQGSPEAEAFLAFQRYVRSLRERGVILAVCSKNDEKNARGPFERHPEMVLKLEDISCFVANWGDKAQNIREIAKRLELGLDALVFVDDNPVERALVRTELPDVVVPELPEDPAEYAATLDRHRCFELAALTEEDRHRADYYRQNALRADAQVSQTDLESFIAGLDMVATIRPIDALDLARATQLTNKSNQYNLTTRRLTEAEMQQIAADPRRVARTFRLCDRFGDNGLVSVVVGREEGDALFLELWIMSCRVLSRGVEHAVLNHLWTEARTRGLRRLLGVYIPTERNGLVRDHYERLGFAPLPAGPGDAPDTTRWELVITGTEPPHRTHIREIAA
jgi:FkbH-like protein